MESRLGKGSTFTLYLPADDVEAPVETVAAAVGTPAAESANGWLGTTGAVSPAILEQLAGKTVLLVDDDIRNVFALTSVLERYDMTVTHASNGTDAIEGLKRAANVDIVLMDVMMPDLDGYDTMRVMRHVTMHRVLPIIALTAKAMVGDREKCLEAGASDYIAKPVNLEELLTMLARHLEKPATVG